MDGGKTWENLSASVRAGVGKDYPYYLGVLLISFVPKGALSNNPNNSLLFISVNGSKWLISIDEGKTFNLLNKSLYPYKVGNKLIDIEDDILYESDDGLHWSKVSDMSNYFSSNPQYYNFTYDASHDTIYCCCYTSTESYVYYSQDGGKTWVQYYKNNLPGFSNIQVCNNKVYLVWTGTLYANSLPSKYDVILLQIGKTSFTVNGNVRTLDSPPVIKNGRTLLPIRAIIEALGGTVGWDPNEKKVTVSLGSNTIELWIGKPTAKVNGIDTSIDPTNSSGKVVPEIINGRTMLPLRFVTENLAFVLFNGMVQHKQ